MSEIPSSNSNLDPGWQQVAQEMHTYHPALQEHAARNLAERGIEISPEHHQGHVDIARPAVPNIDELSSEEQDFVGEVIELGQEALEGDGVQPPLQVSPLMGARVMSNGEIDYSHAAVVTLPSRPKATTPEGPLIGVKRLPSGELDYSSAAYISPIPKTEQLGAQTDQPQDRDISSDRQTTVEKSDELLQAQVASFARKKGYRTGLELFKRMNGLDGKTGDIEYTDHNDPTATHVIRKQDYIDHLREIGGSNDRTIQARKDALEAYKDFSPDLISWLKTIRAERQDVDFGSHNEHPAYLGEGAYNTVFAFTHEGKEYVAKLNDNIEEAGHDVDDVVTDLAAGKGIAHLEQIVAISYVDGVAITERMPGKDFTKLSVDDLELITDEQFSQALSTMKEATSNGIFFDDHNETNYFYDKSAGFGFIDYANLEHSNLTEGSEVPTDSEVATNFIENLVVLDRNGISPERVHEQTPREMNARVALLQRFRAVCESIMQTNNVDYSETMNKVDGLIAEYTQASTT